MRMREGARSSPEATRRTIAYTPAAITAYPVTLGNPSNSMTAATSVIGTALRTVRRSSASSIAQNSAGINAPTWVCGQLVHTTWKPENA